MIADSVKVSVFGKISDKLYSAQITSVSGRCKSAYVISHKPVTEYFEGIVVAVAEFDGLDGERPITRRPAGRRRLRAACGAGAAGRLYPGQISLADQSGKCRTKPQRQVFLIFIFPFRVVDLNKSQKSDRQTARFLSGGKKFLFI